MPKTAYELEREANIARNRALLEQLKVKEAVAALGLPAKPTPTPKSKPIQPSKQRVKKEKPDVEQPRRQSMRLRRGAIDLNESPTKKRKRERDEELQQRKLEQERLAEEERLRGAKKPRHHELDLTTLGEAEKWDTTALNGIRTLFQHISDSPQARRLPAEDAFVFESGKEEEREVASLRERLQNLKVVSRAKVTQDRVYCASYHPEQTKDLVFFGDKHGQLGIWDAQAPSSEDVDDEGGTAEDREGGRYWRLQPHWPATSKSSISCIRFDPLNAYSLFTSAYDCTVRSLSFESGLSREVFSTDDTLISSIDLPPASHEMWVSDTIGGLSHLDLREDRYKARWYQLSDQKIGSVSVNPLNQAYLLTASNSRSLKVWDARKLTSMPSTNDSLDFDLEKIEKLCGSKSGRACKRGEFVHGKSVSSAYWDPRGRSIVSTSYDDTLRLWQIDPRKMALDSPFDNFKPFSTIRHNCQTGRWVTVFRAQWSQNPEAYPHFTVGNMDHSVDIFSNKGELLVKLSDRAKITAVQAVTCSHPSIVERVATGNASGRCVLWAPSEE